MYFFQLKQDSLSKSLIVKEQNEEIVKLKSKIEEQKISLEEFAQNLKTVQEKKEDQDKLIKNLESRNLGEYNMKKSLYVILINRDVFSIEFVISKS